MSRYVAAYFGAALVFACLDAAWLTFASARVYRPALGAVMLDTPRWGPALAFYVLYLAGVVLFAIAPALRSGSWTTAVQLGAALGLVAYGTYDLSNQATLTVWSARLTMIDLAWGTFATATGAAAGYLAGSWVRP